MRTRRCRATVRSVAADEALTALRVILDPELGINIVDLGLVYAVDVTDGHAHVTYTLTTMGCGIGPILEAQMHEVLYATAGITAVSAEMVFDPPWTRDRMSPSARALVGDREFQPMGVAGEFQRLLDRFDQGEFP